MWGGIMEFIVNIDQFEKMIDNKIIGMPELINTKINFRGKNNILVCDNNIKLEGALLEFNGDNSIVYLRSSLAEGFNLTVYNNSTIFIGKNNKFCSSVSVNVFEGMNLIIGDDCLFEDNVVISTSDYYLIYDVNSKERINFSSSIFIGDHVWLGANTYISKGVKIGSGTIVAPTSFIPPYSNCHSNCYLFGNPVKIIKDNVFFINQSVGPLKTTDSVDSEYYKSDIFIYKIINNETLSMRNIDEILLGLDIDSRLEFIQKLFIRNKRKNRFAL